MRPRARTANLDIIEQPGGVLLVDTTTHRHHLLHPLTAFVWKHADGQTSVAELTTQASAALDFDVTEAQVWAAIDVLTGAQLMEGRVAPPAGTQRVNRRDLLRTVATGSAAAAALGVISVREAGAATAEQAAKIKNAEQDVKQAAAKESQQKIHQESAEKLAARKSEEASKRAIQQEQAQKARAQEQEEKKQDRAAQEQSRKDQNQERSIKHENAQEQRSKSTTPFEDVILDPFNWGNIGEGYAPAVFERRGAHVSLFGLVEYVGEEFVPPPIGELPDGQVIVSGDAVDTDDEEDLEIETMLIGTLPEGARPEGTLVFSVPSDALTGNSEVHITASGEILLVLEDESDDELDEAEAVDSTGLSQLKGKDGSTCRQLARLRALRRKRMKARNQARLRRKQLRRRALKARRHRCTDGKEVMLRGPSQVSLAGITYRVKQPA